MGDLAVVPARREHGAEFSIGGIRGIRGFMPVVSSACSEVALLDVKRRLGAELSVFCQHET
jgi:hypothetical protein